MHGTTCSEHQSMQTMHGSTIIRRICSGHQSMHGTTKLGHIYSEHPSMHGTTKIGRICSEHQSMHGATIIGHKHIDIVGSQSFFYIKICTEKPL